MKTYNKIAISGAHGTGKTTIINALKKIRKFDDYYFYDSTSSAAKKDGCNVNLKADENSQLAIFQKHLDRLVNPVYPKSFYDRCILDSLAYTKVSVDKKIIEKSILHYGENLLPYIHNYDAIFYIKPEFDIIDNGLRSLDIEYRNKVVEQYDFYLSIIQNHLNYKGVVFLTGSVENRVQQIISVIN